MMKITKYMYKYIVGIFFIPIPATPPLLHRNLQMHLSLSFIYSFKNYHHHFRKLTELVIIS